MNRRFAFGICLLVQLTCFAVPKEGFYNNEEGSPIIDLIHSAKKSIDIAIYQMSDKNVVTALRKALSKGVKIQIIKEPTPVGDPCKLFSSDAPKSEECKDQKKLMKEIQKAGGKFIPFDKEDLCPGNRTQCFLHGKMVIVDRDTVLVSTGNFNSSNLCDLESKPSRCNRDFTFITREPSSVKVLQSVFEQDLESSEYDLSSTLEDEQLTVSPLSQVPIVALIDSAKKSIILENQYLKYEPMNQALIRAAKRGVEVEVMTSSVCAFSKPKEKEIRKTQRIYTQFDQAGISSLMFGAKTKVKGKKGYLHAKAMVIDQKVGWVGSVNGSATAFSQNREFGIIFDKPKDVQALLTVLKQDRKSAGAETWREAINCTKD